MNKGFFSLFIIAIITIFLANCENDYPASLWNESEISKPFPIIDEIIPHDSTYAGVGEIVIKGHNFSITPEENLVFVGNKSADVIAASEAQITIKSPNIVGDSLKIKIAVHGAELFSDPVYYKLKPAVAIVGNLAEKNEMAYAIAVDKIGNVYVSIDGKIIKKISTDGATTHYADVGFLKANGMKMGPGNTIYVAFAAGRVKKIATITPDGVEGTFTNLPGVPQDLDFDANGNIWVSCDKDIYLIKPDQTTTKITSFSITLYTVRVFNGNLYISGRDENTGEAKIWRSQLLGETLGAAEEVLDIKAAPWLSGATVYSFTFSEDGKMYLTTDFMDAIFVFNPEDGSHDVLFPGLIGPTIYALSWGEGNFLFAIQQLNSASNVLKIDLGMRGAPYYGRIP